MFIFPILRNLITKQVPLLSYGDRGFMEAILHAGDSVPKWLIGSTLTNLAYAAVSAISLHFKSWLPTDIQPSHGFVAIVGALIMGLSSVMLIRRWS